MIDLLFSVAMHANHSAIPVSDRVPELKVEADDRHGKCVGLGAAAQRSEQESQ
ncbi:hypothetical protein [uncultured Bradyrhizobium sp.]|jgi:hypothetical protein|uniref:hypothetical protein n=1 Tax=uncultured Bradyrhizobium sp. TaxID=199684 RepID=UPI002603B28B|nr:hypothetical protein [uncultured Bradyrhizobium sp.]